MGFQPPARPLTTNLCLRCTRPMLHPTSPYTAGSIRKRARAALTWLVSTRKRHQPFLALLHMGKLRNVLPRKPRRHKKRTSGTSTRLSSTLSTLHHYSLKKHAQASSYTKKTKKITRLKHHNSRRSTKSTRVIVYCGRHSSTLHSCEKSTPSPSTRTEAFQRALLLKVSTAWALRWPHHRTHPTRRASHPSTLDRLYSRATEQSR